MNNTGKDNNSNRGAPKGEVFRSPKNATDARATNDAHIRFLRSRADVARSDVNALNAKLLDPDTLEDLILKADPAQAALIRTAEHSLSVRVTEARAVAASAEAAYEAAILDEFDK